MGGRDDGEALPVAVDHLTVAAAPGERSRSSVVGRLMGERLEVTLAAGTLEALLGTDAWPLDIDARGGGGRLQVNGRARMVPEQMLADAPVAFDAAAFGIGGLHGHCLVGKVEAGMDEDDPRNAAVIADLVGDNVGDCAGMAADIFESYEVTIVSSLILGLALSALTGDLFWIILPLLVRGIGVISSIIGTYAVSIWNVDDAEEAMYKSYELSSGFTIISTFILAIFYASAQDPTSGMISHLSLGALVAVGVGLAVAFNPLTAMATSTNSQRVRNIAKATNFGPALVILEGLSLGYMSSVWSALVIAASIAAAILVYTVVFPTALYVPTMIIGGLIALYFIVRGIFHVNAQGNISFVGTNAKEFYEVYLAIPENENRWKPTRLTHSVGPSSSRTRPIALKPRLTITSAASRTWGVYCRRLTRDSSRVRSLMRLTGTNVKSIVTSDTSWESMPTRI